MQGLLLPSPPDSDVSISTHTEVFMTTLPLVDLFRTRFFDSMYDVYCGSQESQYQVCCAKRSFENKVDALFFTERGVSLQRVVVGPNETFENVLRSLEPLLKWSLVRSKRQFKEQAVLTLEARLGRRRGLSVGIIFAARGQWKEEDMVNVPLSKQHEHFLKVLGDEIKAQDINLCQFGSDFVSSNIPLTVRVFTDSRCFSIFPPCWMQINNVNTLATTRFSSIAVVTKRTILQ